MRNSKEQARTHTCSELNNSPINHFPPTTTDHPLACSWVGSLNCNFFCFFCGHDDGSDEAAKGQQLVAAELRQEMRSCFLEFVSGLFQMDPKKRWSAKQAARSERPRRPTPNAKSGESVSKFPQPGATLFFCPFGGFWARVVQF